MEFIFGILLLILNVYAIIKILGSSATTLAKVIWVLLIFFLPFIGFLAWLIAGPKGPEQTRV
jgi:hypothetical protein